MQAHPEVFKHSTQHNSTVEMFIRSILKGGSLSIVSRRGAGAMGRWRGTVDIGKRGRSREDAVCREVTRYFGKGGDWVLYVGGSHCKGSWDGSVGSSTGGGKAR